MKVPKQFKEKSRDAQEFKAHVRYVVCWHCNSLYAPCKLILRAKIALDVVICYYFFLDNGVMTTPKRWILLFVFTILIHIDIFFFYFHCEPDGI